MILPVVATSFVRAEEVSFMGRQTELPAGWKLMPRKMPPCPSPDGFVFHNTEGTIWIGVSERPESRDGEEKAYFENWKEIETGEVKGCRYRVLFASSEYSATVIHFPSSHILVTFIMPGKGSHSLREALREGSWQSGETLKRNLQTAKETALAVVSNFLSAPAQKK